jgi:hypothetical protein
MEIVQVLPLVVGIVVVVAAVIAAAVSPYRWKAALLVAAGGATGLLVIAWRTQTQMGVCAETMDCFLNKATNRCAPGPCELQAQHLRHVAWLATGGLATVLFAISLAVTRRRHQPRRPYDA